MLRTNLSTRPFYNERIIHLLLALAAILVVGLTTFNAIQIIGLSRQNTDFTARINSDRGEARRLTEEARRIRAGIDQAALKATAEAADGANQLIDQRTFSWTAFFNHIEDTLPADVMLTAVRPQFAKDHSIVQMTVLGRQTEDLDEFMLNLEATGAFHNVLPGQQDETEDGVYRVILNAEYVASAAAPEKPKDAARPAGPAGAAAAATPGQEGPGR